ncbi:discoidin domain-containing protein [Promicromonospora soli]
MHHAERTAPARAATVLVLGLALLMTTGLVAPVMLAVPAQADAALLSEGRPALALTRRSAEFPARNAVDGNPETRWASLPEDPQWLRVDLEQNADVQRVEIVWGGAYSTAYSIQFSDDGEVWSTQWSTDKGDGGTDTITVPGDLRGRYVRMRSVTRSGSEGIAIREMRVYGLREGEEPVESGIPAPAPGVSPKPSSDPSPSPKPTPPPAPKPSSLPTVTVTIAPSTRPSPSPSRSAPPKDASNEGPLSGSSPKPSTSPSPSSAGEAGAVQGAEAAAAVGPIVPILYAVGVMAGLVALGIWWGRRLQRGVE